MTESPSLVALQRESLQTVDGVRQPQEQGARVLTTHGQEWILDSNIYLTFNEKINLRSLFETYLFTFTVDELVNLTDLAGQGSKLHS